MAVSQNRFPFPTVTPPIQREREGGKQRSNTSNTCSLLAHSIGPRAGDVRLQLKTGLEGPTAAAARCPLPASQLRTLFLALLRLLFAGMADDCTHMHLFPTFLSPTREVRIVSHLVPVEDVRLVGGGEASQSQNAMANVPTT